MPSSGIEHGPAEPAAYGPGRTPAPLFEGAFLGGFECSTHRLEDGRRLDLAAATRHEEFARADYLRLRGAGITACRDGISWPKVEKAAGQYDFSSVRSRVRAADEARVQVVWDLMHFGWPDDVDVFAPSFPRRFARYALAAARWLGSETEALPMFAPINEMSFLAWAGGDVRCFNPFAVNRGPELKAQLVRAAIEAIEAIRGVLPRARFLQPEPVIHVLPDEGRPGTRRRAEADNLSQYEAWDMMAGRACPSLGGHPRYLDIVGVNFYPHNQFTALRTTIWRGDPRYRPFRGMLSDVWARYGRPMIVSETGTEGDERAPWLEYVCGECVAAMKQGCELHGVTIYPVLDHPGWLDDRHCRNGLWGYANDDGEREAYAPLLEEVLRQSPRLRRARARMLRQRDAAAAARSSSGRGG